MTRVTCRLTAKNRDQLRNPTLGNRKWATFAFLGRGNKLAYLSLRMGTRGTGDAITVRRGAEGVCGFSRKHVIFG